MGSGHPIINHEIDVDDQRNWDQDYGPDIPASLTSDVSRSIDRSGPEPERVKFRQFARGATVLILAWILGGLMMVRLSGANWDHAMLSAEGLLMFGFLSGAGLIVSIPIVYWPVLNWCSRREPRLWSLALALLGAAAGLLFYLTVMMVMLVLSRPASLSGFAILGGRLLNPYVVMCMVHGAVLGFGFRWTARLAR